MQEIKTKNDGILGYDHDLIPTAKWLVGFRNRDSHIPTGKTTIREFRCSGYYEAFERVQGYAQKKNAEVLWFEEKRICEVSLAYAIHLPLESFCTYCDVEHNTEDSIPCPEMRCKSTFCSKKCYEQHIELKHTNSNSLRGNMSKL
jgi:hypothetical protein